MYPRRHDRRRTGSCHLSVTGRLAADCPQSQPQRAPPVSSSQRKGGVRSTDRRVGKTRALLHESLFGLMRERDYHRISVSEILQRANVGRSTFYTHFADKDALFASALQDMLESIRGGKACSSADATERIVGFSLPLFEHIHHHRSAGGAQMGQRGRAVLHEHFRRTLASRIAEEIGARVRGRPARPGRLPQDLLAQYVASTFVLVLDWWVDQKCALSPTEADQLFRSLVLPSLGTERVPEPRHLLSRGR